MLRGPCFLTIFDTSDIEQATAFLSFFHRQSIHCFCTHAHWRDAQFIFFWYFSHCNQDKRASIVYIWKKFVLWILAFHHLSSRHGDRAVEQDKGAGHMAVWRNSMMDHKQEFFLDFIKRKNTLYTHGNLYCFTPFSEY